MWNSSFDPNSHISELLTQLTTLYAISWSVYMSSFGKTVSCEVRYFDERAANWNFNPFPWKCSQNAVFAM